MLQRNPNQGDQPELPQGRGAGAPGALVRHQQSLNRDQVPLSESSDQNVNPYSPAHASGTPQLQTSSGLSLRERSLNAGKAATKPPFQRRSGLATVGSAVLASQGSLKKPIERNGARQFGAKSQSTAPNSVSHVPAKSSSDLRQQQPPLGS